MKEDKFLRDYKGFRFYDAGLYGDTGQSMIEIFVLVKDVEHPESVYIVYYVNKAQGDLNKGIERAKEWVNAVPTCRICKCTTYNCIQCIEKTGSPCHWVEKDLCSACAPEKDIKVIDKRLTDTQTINNTDMNFFQQLAHAGAGKVDLTLRIMQKNEKLTMEVMPGSTKSVGIKPMIFTGTPAELDDEFFKTIAPGVNEVAGIISNIEEVKKEATQKKVEKGNAAAVRKQDKKVDKKQAAKKKAEAKKPIKKKAEKPTAVEGSIFDTPAEQLADVVEADETE